MTDVVVRRVYDEPTDQDGVRVLVDRIWPRGLSKADAHLDEWCKAVAPSTALRTWYGHDGAKFTEFSRRYRVELTEPPRAEALRHLRELADGPRLTLLTATSRPEISQAAVLVDLLGRAPVLPLTHRRDIPDHVEPEPGQDPGSQGTSHKP
ncbi:MAG: DUF488 family protein [Actinophytocola sp.]|uniref:DUF488 domain-containing protein n=1 Tax=Actinophytocola sp. TaxID=1872138 RepID=UPI0013218990|nr:DUF488 family protein [Actinophytocola sp.]MPZ83612.1 DUF488 family protein [Actinophytocola sp.]